MKKSVKAISLVMTAVLLAGVFSACGIFRKPKKIGLLQYAQAASSESIYKGFVDGMKKEGFKKDKHYILEELNAAGDRTALRDAADKFIAEPKDLILTFSTQASQAVYKKGGSVPTVFAAVPNPEKIPLVAKNTEPGGNMTGVSDLASVSEGIKYMHSIFPDIKQIAIVYFPEDISCKFQAAEVAEACISYNISSTECTFDDPVAVEFVLGSLIDKVEALYLPSSVALYGSIDKIVQIASQYNVPIICEDENLVKAGGFFSYGADYYEIGKRAAQMSAKILRGEAQPGSMPVEYLSDFSITVNRDVMNKLGVTLPEEISSKAKFVDANS